MFMCRLKLFVRSLLVLVFPALATHVAVLETTAASGVITLEEKQYLTDVLRSEAVKALPAEQNYVIMTRENISMMLPPGKAIEDCEGSCLVETGKNISADYITQGHVGRFANNLTITVELYETAGNKLMGSFSSKADKIETLEIEIRQKSAELFSRIVASSFGKVDFQPVFDEKMGGESELVITVDSVSVVDGRKYVRGVWELTPGIHDAEFIHPCYEPQKFKINVLSGKTTEVKNPLQVAMGNLSISTEYKGVTRDVPLFVDGVKVGSTPYNGRVPICAQVEVGDEGFREKVNTDWGDQRKLKVVHKLRSAKPTKEELRADSLAKLEQIAREIAEEAALNASLEESKTSIAKPISIAMMVLGAVGAGIGIYENVKGNDERKKYNELNVLDQSAYDDAWDKVQSAKTMRNIFYGVGFGMMGVGTILFIVF